MIDYFALALTHGLILLALLRIAGRPELDREDWEPSAAQDAEAVPAPDKTRPRRAKRKRRDA